MRLFIAVPLPDPVRDTLDSLEGVIPNARFVPWDHFHITLRFLGDISDLDMPDLVRELNRVTPPRFALRLSGLDFFGPPHRPRSLWARVDRSPALGDLHTRVEAAVRRAGIAPERRKFMPHVTIARMSGRPDRRFGEFLQMNGAVATEPFEVIRFALFRSLLREDGPIYDEIAEFPLSDPPGVGR